MRAVDWVMLLGTAVLFGSSFTFLKIAVAELSPLHLATARVTVAAVVLAGVLIVAGRRFPRDARSLGAIALLGILLAVVPYTAIAWGQTRIDASLGGILFATIPVFTAILSPLVPSEPPLTVRQIPGLTLAFLGVVLSIGPGALSELTAQVAGAAVTLLAALSYAVGTLYARSRAAMDPLAMSAGQLLTGALILVPLSFSLKGPLPAELASETVMATLAVGSVATAIPVLFMIILIGRVGATRTALLTYFIPVASVLIGVLALGERLPVLTLAGFGMILAGAVWFARAAPKLQ